ncbi:uncharacterized protein LOC144270453 [Eretmochelys imbricata]
MQSQNRKRAPAWSELETLDLIAVWGEESLQAELQSSRRNTDIYAKIAQGMVDRDYTRDTQQCHMKIKELRQAYQKTKEANGPSGSEAHTCRFYDQLHGILGGNPTTTPPLSMNTCKGEASRNTEEDFVDEEEEEEEENAQQASGESVLPGSQDLFITLEPIPSQGVLFPDPEGGEVTSAANVSMLPVSTPSLRLSHIRRQKNRTCNDMFLEFMQSSRTDRAQLNAWRHSVAEARKAYSECDQNMQEEMLRLMGEQTDMMRCLVELQEKQLEYGAPLHPLCNGLPSSPSSIPTSPRSPRTWGRRLRAPCHSTSMDGPSNRRLSFQQL